TEAADKRKEVQRAVVAAMRASAYSRPKYFNILDYQPNLQMKASTAIVLSARFPYVTPPGVLLRNSKEDISDDTLRETAGLQLIDGGFADNSGIATALEIVRQLRNSERTKGLVGNVDFHLVSFGHAKLALNSDGTRDAQSELVAPLATFEA